MLAKYDTKNPVALKALAASGAQLRSFSEEIMTAAFDASRTVYSEISAENAGFKAQWEAQQAFLNDWYQYSQTAEFTYDYFMMLQQRNGKLTPA